MLSLLTPLDQIREIAEYSTLLSNPNYSISFLMNWWSNYYNRPIKDPLLQEYTLHELMYEFHTKTAFKRQEQERDNKNRDKIEEEQASISSEALAWADQMEEEDEELEKPNLDPLSDPENIKWMQDLLNEEKQKHGETFGEEMSIDFDSEE